MEVTSLKVPIENTQWYIGYTGETPKFGIMLIVRYMCIYKIGKIGYDTFNVVDPGCVYITAMDLHTQHDYKSQC